MGIVVDGISPEVKELILRCKQPSANCVASSQSNRFRKIFVFFRSLSSANGLSSLVLCLYHRPPGPIIFHSYKLPCRKLRISVTDNEGNSQREKRVKLLNKQN